MRRVLCTLSAVALGACTWETDLPDRAASIHVDVSREVLLTDDALLSGGPALPEHRLIAIANRTDLSVMPDRAADGGEAHFVYAPTNGDRMAVIVEYAQPGTAREWEARWHAVKTADDVASIAAQLGPIAQIRTADARDGAVVLRQFDEAMVPALLRNEPDYSRISTPELQGYATAQAAALADGTSVMPRGWWASSAVVAAPPAGVPTALANETCTGCHAKSESGFQIDPTTRRPSRFLSDPSAPSDELRRRVTWMQLTLSAGLP